MTTLLTTDMYPMIFSLNDQTIMVYALQHNKEHNDQNCWFPSPTPLDYPP